MAVLIGAVLIALAVIAARGVAEWDIPDLKSSESLEKQRSNDP